MKRSRRLTLFAALAVAAVAALLLAGCGVADFSSGSAPDVQQLADKAGVVVLDQGTAQNRYEGGTTAAWYAVGREGSEDVSAVVNVLRFEDQQARDAALRQISFRMNRGLANTVIYTAGDAVIEVTRLRDFGTVQDLDQALRDAGAL
jgi:hypothetical protein